MKNPIAILLSAGMSTRMGSTNKLLLPFQKSTIVQTTIENLLNSNISELIVVVGHESGRMQKVLENYQLTIVVNENFRSGQVSSIKKGLSALKKNVATPFFIALADMPLITSNDFNLLITRFLQLNTREKIILRPKSSLGIPGNPVLFDASFQDILLNNSESEKSAKVIHSYRQHLHYFKTDVESYFLDVDTKEIYGKLNSSG